MKTHKEKEFLTWASNHGIGVDDRYPRSAVLTFKPDPDCDSFWDIPIEPERLGLFTDVKRTKECISISPYRFHMSLLTSHYF